MSNDFLGTLSISLEGVSSLDCKDGETDALMIGLLDLLPEARDGDGSLDPNMGPKLEFWL